MTMLEPAFAEHHIKIGRDRLFGILRDHNLLIRPRRRYARTTDSNHHYHKWPNLIEKMEITRSEQVWVSDITYIRTQNGFLYLSLVTDAYSRKLMGYHLSHTLEAKGVVAALKMAISQRQYPGQPLIHHSDRGVQYCSANVVKTLQDAEIRISMAEKGSPSQNALAERVNRTIKEQLLMDTVFDSYRQALAQLIQSVKTYNHLRPHTSCSNLTPQKAHETEGPLLRHWKNYANKPPTVGGADALQTSSQV